MARYILRTFPTLLQHRHAIEIVTSHAKILDYSKYTTQQFFIAKYLTIHTKMADACGNSNGRKEDGNETSEKPGFQFTEVNGDLFSCPSSHSLAHCISADVRLGKGIATIFRNKFGGIDDLKKQGAKTGGLAVLRRDGRFIYNLVTKDKYWQKPTYSTLESSLMALRKHCVQNGVRDVAMPMIGCGLDRLEWKRVEEIIRDVFGSSDISITVYRL